MTTTLFRGGHVYSTTDPYATAIVIEDDTIAWVGGDGAAAVHAEDVDDVVPLDGALVTPAFVDAHVHLTSTGLTMTGLDLAGSPDRGEVTRRLRDRATASRGRPVLGHGWDETAWADPRPPTRTELDRASFGAAVYLARIDVHSCLASSALLALAPQVRDLPGFSESGWLRQDAHHAVRAVALDAITPNQRHEAQSDALDAAAALGVGMVHEIGGPGISDARDFGELMEPSRHPDAPQVVGYWGEGRPSRGAGPPCARRGRGPLHRRCHRLTDCLATAAL